jgi:hypothetical protein
MPNGENVDNNLMIEAAIWRALSVIQKNTYRNVLRVQSRIVLSRIYSKTGNRIPDALRKTITEEILICLTQTDDPSTSKYYYGLFGKIDTHPLVPQLHWILQDSARN